MYAAVLGGRGNRGKGISGETDFPVGFQMLSNKLMEIEILNSLPPREIDSRHCKWILIGQGNVHSYSRRKPRSDIGKGPSSDGQGVVLDKLLNLSVAHFPHL